MLMSAIMTAKMNNVFYASEVTSISLLCAALTLMDRQRRVLFEMISG